jgi:hypothetical protein
MISNQVIYLRIERFNLLKDRTLGKLFVNDEFFCYTLELPVHSNRKRLDAIPAGDYPVIMQAMNSKPKWGLLPLILDVPNRDGIFMHIANKPKEIFGCVALGMGIYKNNNLKSSKIAVDSLCEILKEAYGITLTIEDKFS